jgi:hypothetical protein
MSHLNNKYKKGFLLYFSVLFASIALFVGLFIINISMREISFSNIARQSDYAFYAAESGAECALYWDLVGVNSSSVFPSHVDQSTADVNGTTIQCQNGWSVGNGNSQPTVIVIDFNVSVGVMTLSQFKFNTYIDTTRSYCSEVEVLKNKRIDGSVETYITSAGYSVDCSLITSKRSDIFQRVVTLTY